MKLQRSNDTTDYQLRDRHENGNMNREKDITDYQLNDRRVNETSKVWLILLTTSIVIDMIKSNITGGQCYRLSAL